jgi:hypothetical protein
MKQEQQIDKTLESLNGLQRIPVPEGLRKRLESIPGEIIIMDNRIPMRSVWPAVASILFLITFNVVAVRHYTGTQTEKDNTIYTEYFSYLDEI